MLVFDRAGSFASAGGVVDGARAALFLGAAVAVLAARGRARHPGARPQAAVGDASRRARSTPLAELEARQGHAARARRIESARAAGGDEARDDEAQAAVGDHPVRQTVHDDEPAVGEHPPPARQVGRRVLRIGVTGQQQHGHRATTTIAPVARADARHGARRPAGRAARAQPTARARKLPLPARSVAATPKRAQDSPQIVTQNMAQAGAGVELGAHVAGELARERHAVAGGGLVHEQRHADGIVGRAQQHGDRRGEGVAVRRCCASTRDSSARVSGNARRHAACATQRATTWRSARSALRAASSYTGEPGSDAPSSVAVRTERG